MRGGTGRGIGGGCVTVCVGGGGGVPRPPRLCVATAIGYSDRGGNEEGDYNSDNDFGFDVAYLVRFFTRRYFGARRFEVGFGGLLPGYVVENVTGVDHFHAAHGECFSGSGDQLRGDVLDRSGGGGSVHHVDALGAIAQIGKRRSLVEPGVAFLSTVRQLLDLERVTLKLRLTVGRDGDRSAGDDAETVSEEQRANFVDFGLLLTATVSSAASAYRRESEGAVRDLDND